MYNTPMAPQRTIIVFGGAFSPPTLAHEAIIAQCLARPDVAEVWLLPSGHRTDKQIAVAHQHQLAMLHVVWKDRFGGDPRLRIDDREVRRDMATETDDTYAELQRQHPNTDFWFVYGADSYQSIHSWQNGHWLATRLPVFIAPRGNSPLPRQNQHIHLLPPLPVSVQHISSTSVRERMLAGKDISESVSAPIATYIRTHNLFV